MIKRTPFMHDVPDSQLTTAEKAIREAFPNNADSILENIRYDSLNGCFMFDFAGMYVGCELDGYIHS